MARYIRKEFLSPAAWETGSIVCQIETPLVKDISEYLVKEGAIHMHSSMKLMDCSRGITLDFDCHDQSSFEKRLAKLDTMLKEVQDMRNQYAAMWENGLRNLEHRKNQLAQEAIDKQAARDAQSQNYRGPR